MTKLKPGMAIDAAEAKILKHRIENSFASPGVLSLLSMFSLVAFCYAIGRADWMVIVSTLLLGGGVFLYSLARLLDRLVAIQKAMQETEMRLLSGATQSQTVATKSADGSFWHIRLSEDPEVSYSLPVPTGTEHVVMVSGARLYSLWVDRRIRSGGGLLQAGLPPLRDEMKRSEKALRGRGRLLAGTGALPTLRLKAESDFRIQGGEDELMELIVARASSFPVIAADKDTAEVLRKHATI